MNGVNTSYELHTLSVNGLSYAVMKTHVLYNNVHFDDIAVKFHNV